jgi:hypothetical protein
MDIVRAFTDWSAGLERDIHINIMGTADDPLFQASQIGKDFNEDERDGVSSTDAIGRQQTTIFLTELGLYRLVGASRKAHRIDAKKTMHAVLQRRHAGCDARRRLRQRE